MKIRMGFVSNSSSSSFVISIDDLTYSQEQGILFHGRVVNNKDDEWVVYRSGTLIEGYTFMDNFDMHHYLTIDLSIPENVITWGE
jgi:hypothetical protein